MWQPPLAAPSDGGFKLASPKPPAPKVRKIIADNLPDHTFSASVYDPPKRKNVIQIGLPTSTTKDIQYEIDPRTQLTPNVNGNTFHGIDPERPVKHGMFLQKSEVVHPAVLGKSKNTPPVAKPKHHKKSAKQHRTDHLMSNLTGEALEASRKVELGAKKMSEGIEVKPVNGQMQIHMLMTNKREKGDLQLHTKKK